ncbi:MAG: helix-turn-helix domain-containing protein [Lentisphaerae bacterium]|nr:helix-turn-helix domain-containing protein [Lentisphaerota bacterium]
MNNIVSVNTTPEPVAYAPMHNKAPGIRTSNIGVASELLGVTPQFLGDALKLSDTDKFEGCRLWDEKETESRTNVSYWTLRRLVKRGELNPVRIGKRVLFRPEDIKRFIDSRICCKKRNKHIRGN